MKKSLPDSGSDNPSTTKHYTDRYGNTSVMNIGGLSDLRFAAALRYRARGSTQGERSANKKPPAPKWKDAHLTTTPNPPSINFKAGDTVELINPSPASGWSPGSKVVIADVFHDSQAVLIELDETQTNLFKRFGFDEIRLAQFQPPDLLGQTAADELREQVHQGREDVAILMADRDKLAIENAALKKERGSFLQDLDRLAGDVNAELLNRVKPGTRIQHVKAGLGTVIETPSGQAPGLWIQFDHGNRFSVEPAEIKPVAEDVPNIDFSVLSDLALQAIISSAARELERRASTKGE